MHEAVGALFHTPTWGQPLQSSGPPLYQVLNSEQELPGEAVRILPGGLPTPRRQRTTDSGRTQLEQGQK